MSATYITSDGDILDDIAYQQYGSVTPDILNAVLAANYGLCELGPIYGPGVAIVLPSIDTATVNAATNEVSLWT